MGKISNVTNSSDPSAVNSRIFVGNLNTFVLTKDNVESIFVRYGTIVGISMHKGYAFVQYATEAEARNAVLGEDQRVYATQPIDVNMTSEPKPNRPSRKRPPAISTEWDYFYNLPVQRLNNVAGAPAACTPIKRTCPDFSAMLLNTATLPNMSLTTPMLAQRQLYSLPVSSSCPLIGLNHRPGDYLRDIFINCATRSIDCTITNPVLPARKYIYPSASPKCKVSAANKTTTSVPTPVSTTTVTNGTVSQVSSAQTLTEVDDILICGKCRSLFRFVSQFMAHKRTSCKPRCDCSTPTSEKEPLRCASCGVTPGSSWALLQHCQQEHGLSLYAANLQNKQSGDSGDESNCPVVTTPTSQNASEPANTADPVENY